MKKPFLRKVRAWAISAGLFAGIVYSVLALTSKPVYASSCDCDEAYTDAQEFCTSEFPGQQVYTFDCPLGQPNFIYTQFTCTVTGATHTLPCAH
jgi:hypothetical protein